MSATAYIKDSRLSRVFAGHPWIYETDLFTVKDPPEDGQVVTARTQAGGFVGLGFYNSKSSIRIRLMSREKGGQLDGTWLAKRIQQAIAFRQTFAKDRPSLRMVWSEADLLSGLIVDRYDQSLVVQTLSLGLDQRLPEIVSTLRQLLSPTLIVERNDVPSRRFEGLTEQKKVVLEPEGGVRNHPVRLGSALFHVDLVNGQKTGGYLDQQDNWERVASFCPGKKVLDCFTYHGGFAIHAALAGATEVEGIDISDEAVATARRNMELNKVACHFTAANVFDRLGTLVKEKKNFDLVILDPPSFTKSRAKLEDALRGYKQIHLKAFKLLSPGGLLATFCCSHHVDTETFRGVALDAAFDCRKNLRLIRTFTQSADHPVLPAVPETEYLKGFLFQVL